jgi:hypothetical protein
MNADRIALIAFAIVTVGVFAINFGWAQSSSAPMTPRIYVAIPSPGTAKGSAESIWILDQVHGTVRWCHVTAGDQNKVRCATE